MLKINNIKLPVRHTEEDIRNKIIKELKLKNIIKGNIDFSYEILKKSIDARKKPEITYIYSVCVDFKDKEDLILKRYNGKNVLKYTKNAYAIPRLIKKDNIPRPVIAGSGPCGLFCGYILALAGLKPIIVERGDSVEKRIKKVEKFFSTGNLDKNTNIQFGEGGAGTFSDGKLNTSVKDPSGRNGFVLETFHKFGAKENILYDAKPHIGTDILRETVVNMREEIKRLGGDFLYCCKVVSFAEKDGELVTVTIDNYSDEEYLINGEFKISKGLNTINTDKLVLATGHSARDTFRMLYEKKLEMSSKNFAVGFRVMHPQNLINNSQYGENHDEILPAADYKVVNHASNGKSVYSFCMCPGGFVVNSSSDENQAVVNGMSYVNRDSKHANSAIVVNVDENDFGNSNVLDGMYFQEKIEKISYELGEGAIPFETFGDFKSSKKDVSYDEFVYKNMSFLGKCKASDLRNVFSNKINEAFVESMEVFGYTIKGFDSEDALMFSVESRTSSPVRILRGEDFQSNVKGIYPAGEGAGYAGGITSAAIDGIKVAEALIKSIND